MARVISTIDCILSFLYAWLRAAVRPFKSMVVQVWGFSDGLGIYRWQLPEREQRRLVEPFPPVYAVDPDLQHHVTFEYGVNRESQLPTATSGLSRFRSS
jgi:hypothetical protein